MKFFSGVCKEIARAESEPLRKDFGGYFFACSQVMVKNQERYLY